jgi:hypothetical protein
VEAALEELKGGLPAGMGEPQVTMRQATFIEVSIDTLRGKLVAAVGVVAIGVVFLFAEHPDHNDCTDGHSDERDDHGAWCSATSACPSTP